MDVHIIHVQEYSVPSSQNSNNEKENWQRPLKTYLLWVEIKTTPSFNYKSLSFHGNVHIIHVQEYSASSSQKSNNERRKLATASENISYMGPVQLKTTPAFNYKSLSFHENVDPVHIIHVQEYSAPSSQNSNNERENWQRPLQTYLTWVQLKTTPAFNYKSLSFHGNVHIIHTYLLNWP